MGDRPTAYPLCRGQGQGQGGVAGAPLVSAFPAEATSSWMR